jgi:ribosomal protein S18 acetylase RimI-like enzyme
MTDLMPGYRLWSGSSLDHATLLKFMQRAYREFSPAESTAHLADTVQRYLSSETPLWWVEPDESQTVNHSPAQAIACLWMGTAVDQTEGDRNAYILLLYVAPEHRRRGIASHLMAQAERWANERGDRQIGLQVFQTNQPALALYEKLGYQTHSIWMVKPLTS